MGPERCSSFIFGKHISGYPNVAMPSDGVYVYIHNLWSTETDKLMGFLYLNI